MDRGFVYVLWDGDSYKVGWSASDPLERLKKLQTGNPKKLTLAGCKRGSRQDERALHDKLYDYRRGGGSEWFSDSLPVRLVLALHIVQVAVPRLYLGADLTLPMEQRLKMPGVDDCLFFVCLSCSPLGDGFFMAADKSDVVTSPGVVVLSGCKACGHPDIVPVYHSRNPRQRIVPIGALGISGPSATSLLSRQS